MQIFNLEIFRRLFGPPLRREIRNLLKRTHVRHWLRQKRENSQFRRDSESPIFSPVLFIRLLPMSLEISGTLVTLLHVQGVLVSCCHVPLSLVIGKPGGKFKKSWGANPQDKPGILGFPRKNGKMPPCTRNS